MTLLGSACALAVAYWLLPDHLRKPSARRERRAFRASVAGDLAFIPVEGDQ